LRSNIEIMDRKRFPRLRDAVYLCAAILAVIHFGGTAIADEVHRRIETLLAGPLENDASREIRVKELTALGEPGSRAMAEMLGTRDLFRFMTLRAALIAQGATASPALREMVDSPPPLRARAAMGVLAEIGNPKDADFFLAHLKGFEWPLRAAAARGAGRTRVVSATVEEPLWSALGDEDDSVRRYAAGALGEVGTARSLSQLAETLKDESFYVRRASARAIARCWSRGVQDHAVLRDLIRLAGEETAPGAQMEAIGLLGLRDEPEAVSRLKGLTAHPDWAIRAAAIQALKGKHEQWLRENRIFERDPDPLVRGLN
jgi:hypothetical protein